MVTLTSKSDSSTFSGEDMQLERHLSYYFFSLTTNINCDSQNARVPVAQRDICDQSAPGVRIHFFFTPGCLSIPFRL